MLAQQADGEARLAHQACGWDVHELGIPRGKCIDRSRSRRRCGSPGRAWGAFVFVCRVVWALLSLGGGGRGGVCHLFLAGCERFARLIQRIWSECVPVGGSGLISIGRVRFHSFSKSPPEPAPEEAAVTEPTFRQAGGRSPGSIPPGAWARPPRPPAVPSQPRGGLPVLGAVLTRSTGWGPCSPSGRSARCRCAPPSPDTAGGRPRRDRKPPRARAPCTRHRALPSPCQTPPGRQRAAPQSGSRHRGGTACRGRFRPGP
mmetsp:Transcript_11039/g.28657  ORF Transcript_11039/g.28657 Transcript_11039/m.28657 type:complete len:259 (+) Transcript_11039:103-879(+)